MDKRNEISKDSKVEKAPVKDSGQTLPEKSLEIQYQKLSEDWRQFNNILWGIPTVAVSIMAGIIVAAYQPALEGWPRFVSLSVGSLFLFALTLEVAKKRLHMDITEDVLTKLQELRALRLGEYKLSWRDAYDSWDKEKDSEPYKNEGLAVSLNHEPPRPRTKIPIMDNLFSSNSGWHSRWLKSNRHNCQIF